MSTWNFLDYSAAKKRREILLSHFSRKSIIELQHLVQDRVCLFLPFLSLKFVLTLNVQLDILCDAISRQYEAGKSSDFYHAFKCFSIDTITSVCFAKPVNATDAPDFKAPIVMAMDESLNTLQVFVFFKLARTLAAYMPPSLLVVMNKALQGYVDFRNVRR